MATNQYGIVDTAQNQLTRDYSGYNPIAPAGINDTTRQGWTTNLEGMASRLGGAEDYSTNMSNLGNLTSESFLGGMNSGQFTNNQNIQGGSGLLADTASSGGWNSGTADAINQTGASFDVWNPYLQNAITSSNQQIAQDFNQAVMPELNQGLVNSGQGAYGGTRAGVAQGLREQSLADAIGENTTNLTYQGYESGLDRYISDRANTLSATGTAGTTAADAASNLGTLGLGQLSQGNQMYTTGYGTLLPNAVSNTYEASQTPGLLTSDIGTTLSGYGTEQQTADQSYIDWVNSAYNDAQDYGDNRLANYSNVVSPYLQSGTSGTSTGTSSSSTSSGNNTIGSLLSGASTGLGVYDTLKNNQNNSSNTGTGNLGASQAQLDASPYTFG